MVQVCAVLLLTATLFAAETNQPAIKVIAKGAFSGIQEAKQIVITNQTQWAEVWQKHNLRNEPKRPAPEIDFKKQTVLFVTLGQKRTGGYSIDIVDVSPKDGKTEVLLRTGAPKPGSMSLQALTAPFAIVAVPKIEGEVAFKTESQN